MRFGPETAIRLGEMLKPASDATVSDALAMIERARECGKHRRRLDGVSHHRGSDDRKARRSGSLVPHVSASSVGATAGGSIHEDIRANKP